MLPPLGAQLAYSVGSDPKTGRARAENVRRLDGAAAAEAPLRSVAPPRALVPRSVTPHSVPPRSVPPRAGKGLVPTIKSDWQAPGSGVVPPRAKGAAASKTQPQVVPPRSSRPASAQPPANGYGPVVREDAPSTVELAIPAARCGLLVGPNGQVFKDLELNFGVALQVPRRGDPDGTLTRIMGPAAAVTACCEEVTRLVHGDCTVVSSSEQEPQWSEAPPRHGGGNAGGHSGGVEAALSLHIPISRCGLLIGKGGSIFKSLQQTYGVTLNVPSQGDPEGSLTILAGPKPAVDACMEDIMKRVRGECTVVK